MNEERLVHIESDVRRAKVEVFWGETFIIIGVLLSSWQTYVFAVIAWVLITVF